jgi:hypothetical protein
LKLVQSPLLWFMVIGVLIFIVDNHKASDAIIVDESVRSRISGLWETQMRRPPTAEELKSLIDAWVREEVLYREARRLGLAEDDTIVRRRLVQKLNFLVQDVTDEVITDEELNTYYDANFGNYTSTPRYTFMQIFMQREQDSQEVLKQLETGADPSTLGDATMLPGAYAASTQQEIAASLGREFAELLKDLSEGQWVGPVKSTFGFHLVLLQQIHPTTITPLSVVENRVRADLVHERNEAAGNAYYEALLEKIEIVHE